MTAKSRGKTRPDVLGGEVLSPAPRQRRSRANRERLVDAALHLFSMHGYKGVAVESVAARAGVPIGGFYLHFRSKRQLLRVLIGELLATLEALNLQPAAVSDSREAIRDLMQRAVSADLRYLGAYRAWQEAVSSDPGIARINDAIERWSRRRLTILFEELQKRPGARRDVDVPALARAVDRLVWSVLGDAARGASDLTAWVDSITHLVYHALFADRPRRRGRRGSR